MTGYLLATTFAFQEAPTLRGFFTYPLVYVVQYALSAGLLHVLIQQLDVAVRIAPLVVSVLVFPVTFVLGRIVVARTKKSDAEIPALDDQRVEPALGSKGRELT